MGSDVMLSESVKRSAARLKRMSAREKEQRERERSREGTPQVQHNIVDYYILALGSYLTCHYYNLIRGTIMSSA